MFASKYRLVCLAMLGVMVGGCENQTAGDPLSPETSGQQQSNTQPAGSQPTALDLSDGTSQLAQALADKLSPAAAQFHADALSEALRGNESGNVIWRNDFDDSGGVLTLVGDHQLDGEPCKDIQQVVKTNAETIFVTSTYCNNGRQWYYQKSDK